MKDTEVPKNTRLHLRKNVYDLERAGLTWKGNCAWLLVDEAELGDSQDHNSPWRKTCREDMLRQLAQSYAELVINSNDTVCWSIWNILWQTHVFYFSAIEVCSAQHGHEIKRFNVDWNKIGELHPVPSVYCILICSQVFHFQYLKELDKKSRCKTEIKLMSCIVSSHCS